MVDTLEMRLRNAAQHLGRYDSPGYKNEWSTVCDLAADEIARLRAALAQPETQVVSSEHGDGADALMLPVHRHLQDALRIPRKPWPDPFAHGHEATGRAIHADFCALRFKVMDALAALTAARCGIAALPPPAAPTCPHIRSSGQSHWCALAEAAAQPKPAEDGLRWPHDSEGTPT